MPWANGLFTLSPVSHADPGTTIRADQQNVPHEDFAAGFNNCLTRDGSTSMLANLPMNGRKIVNLAQGTAASDAVRLDQLPASSEWLEAVAALTMAADRFPYATGTNTAALATLTAFARTLLDDPDAATARATLGLTIATAALAVLNAAADHNTAAWQAGTETTPGFPSPAQLRAAFNATGSAPVFAPRAWVNFDGTQEAPAISAAGNVSSVTRLGEGHFRVNFSTAMPSANYAFLGSAQVLNVGGDADMGVYFAQIAPGSGAITASRVDIYTGDVTGTAGGGYRRRRDLSRVSLAVFI